MIVLKVKNIGNMVDIEGMKEAILDGMSRCTEGSDVYNTYDAVVEMLTSISNDYDAENSVENLVNEILKN